MQITAKLNNLRMSPRKVRLVANLLKGMGINEAKMQLNFLAKKASRPVAKLLDSAAANAKHNFNLDKDNLYIVKIAVGQGSTLKRWMPRAFGRATPIHKRTSHITLILEEKDLKQKRVSHKSKKAVKEKFGAGTRVEDSVEQEKERAVKVKTASRAREIAKGDGKKFFSRPSLSNIKKSFRRKSV